MRRAPRVGTLAFVAAVSAVYLPQMLFSRSPAMASLIASHTLLVVSALVKLACLGAGAVYGVRIFRRLAPSNPARRPWAMLAGWLALWSVAQAILMTYEATLGSAIPVPSIGDLGFLLGFVCLFAAQIEFIVVYRRSGFPIGSARQHALVAGGAAALVAAISLPLLLPIARATLPGASLAGALINLIYPLLDLLAVIPAVVLLRIALAFRPGRVWAVWSALVAGFLLMAVGDFVSTSLWPNQDALLEPAVHLTYLLGYYFAALGMKLQDELVAS